MYLYNVCDFTIKVQRINNKSFRMNTIFAEKCMNIFECWKYFSYECVFNHRNEPVILSFLVVHVVVVMFIFSVLLQI